MRRARSLPVLIVLGVIVAGTAGALFLYRPQIFALIDEEMIRAERAKRWALASVGETLPGTPDLASFERRLAEAGVKPGAAIFVRIFKREFELELWVKRGDKFERFATYPICMWSGDLGPKFKEGDRQTPEGFYTVDAAALNPNSKYRRSFNLGYPNALEREHQRTGSLIMVHGNCLSIGCYAMTDPVIDEIWTMVTAALRGGQPRFQVQSFPFRMTDANLARYAHDPAAPFWRELKEGYDLFEKTRVPPTVSVCRGRYAFAPASGAKDGSAAIASSCPAAAAGT